MVSGWGEFLPGEKFKFYKEGNITDKDYTDNPLFKYVKNMISQTKQKKSMARKPLSVWTTLV